MKTTVSLGERSEDELDGICRRRTGFASFGDLLSAPGYVPTIRCTKETNRNASRLELVELLALADAYDSRMAATGDSRRAYRG